PRKDRAAPSDLERHPVGFVGPKGCLQEGNELLVRAYASIDQRNTVPAVAGGFNRIAAIARAWLRGPCGSRPIREDDPPKCGQAPVALVAFRSPSRRAGRSRAGPSGAGSRSCRRAHRGRADGAWRILRGRGPQLGVRRPALKRTATSARSRSNGALAPAWLARTPR